MRTTGRVRQGGIHSIYVTVAFYLCLSHSLPLSHSLSIFSLSHSQSLSLTPFQSSMSLPILFYRYESFHSIFCASLLPSAYLLTYPFFYLLLFLVVFRNYLISFCTSFHTSSLKPFLFPPHFLRPYLFLFSSSPLFSSLSLYNIKVMTVCATRGDGARALNLARDQRTSNCGPPQEKFMVFYTVLVLCCVVVYCTALLGCDV
jgi:hypothetical protein